MRGNRVRLAWAAVAAVSLAIAVSPTSTGLGMALTGDGDEVPSIAEPTAETADPATPVRTPALSAGLLTAAPRSPLGSSGPVADRPSPTLATPVAGKPVVDDVHTVPPPSRLGFQLRMPPPPPPQSGPIDCHVQQCIALTFDDGPGESTAALLDELAKQNVKATFFLVGTYVHGRADVVRRMAAEGHVIGDHTWSHQDLAKLPPAAAHAEIERGAQAVQQVTGQRPVLLRPPYGSFVKGKTPEGGMAIAMWSVDTLDWKTKDTKAVSRAALAGAKRNSVILMHDVHPTTVAAVPWIVTQLRRQGYTLVTVPQLFGQVAPGGVYIGQR